MRTLVHLLLGIGSACCLYFMSATAQESWHWQNPLPTANDYSDIAFADSNSVTIVGRSGTILRSTDGGSVWTVGSINTKEDLVDVCFATTDSGYCMDRRGKIFRSIDGGSEWMELSTLTGTFYGLPAFWNNNLGLIVGSRGGMNIVFRTTDHGQSWTEEPLSVSGSLLLSDFAISANGTGIMVGDDGLILRTSDMGRTWQRIATDVITDLAKVIQVDQNRSIIFTRGNQVLTSVDNGQSWTARPLEKEIWGVAVMDSTHYVGSGRYGFIARSSDGGDSWYFENDSIGPGWQVCATNSMGIAIGIQYGGVIRRSTDYGNSWKDMHYGTTRILDDVAFSSELSGTAVGIGVITHTVDGGKHWEIVLQHSHNLKGIDFSDDGYGIAVGWGAMYRTTDGGAVWTPLPCDSNIAYLDVKSLGSGRWIVLCYGGTPVRTENNGDDWTRTKVRGSYYAELYSIDFANPSVGIAVGRNGILRTSDGGQVWESVVTDVLSSFTGIAHVDRSMWIVVGFGGWMQVSYDDGTSWSVINSGTTENLNGVVASSDTTIYIVGNNGTVLSAKYTLESLAQVVTPSHQDYNAVTLTANKSVYLVGDQGTIVSSSTPGVVSAHEPAYPALELANDDEHVFPNPASAFITIPYHVARGGRVLIDLCDGMGNVVAVVVDDEVDAGDYEAPFQTHSLTNGVYVVRIRFEDLIESKTFVVMR